MKYRLAIFDFDGTLADSFPFFLGAYEQLAEQHGLKRIRAEEAPALRHLDTRQMMKHVGLPLWKLPFVAKSFISLMRQHATGISLFDQVEEMLCFLADAGLSMAIVSSNSLDNVSQVLGPENLKHFSQFECGMSIFGKASRIGKVLKKAGIPHDQAIYIGDQVADLEAARKKKVAFGAVSWGFATIESLRKHEPEELFDSVAAIKRLAAPQNQA